MKHLGALGIVCGAVSLWASGCGDDDGSVMDSGAGGSGSRPPDAAVADAGVFAGASEVELVQAFLARSFDPSGDAGIPEDVVPGNVTLAVREGRGQLTYFMLASCGTPFDALMVREGDDAHVLFRSGEPTGCGGAVYRLRVVIDDASEDTRAYVYVQQAEGDAIAALGRVGSSGVDADCTGLVACSADEPCDREGPISDELVIDAPRDTHGCATLDVCGHSACIDHREACMMTCGTAECVIQGSYPVQVRCDP